MYEEIEDFIDAHGGVMTVSELAVVTDENENLVRRWARENDVRRCGATFVFSLDKALEFAEDVTEGDDDNEVADEGDDLDDEGDLDGEGDLDDEGDDDEGDDEGDDDEGDDDE